MAQLSISLDGAVALFLLDERQEDLCCIILTGVIRRHVIVEGIVRFQRFGCLNTSRRQRQWFCCDDGQRIDLAGLQSLLGRPHSRIVLAEAEGRLIACAHIERLATAGYFGMFAVDPTRQAGGIGRAVLAECERQLFDEFDCDRIEMTVLWQRQELIDWYRRRGYRATGEERPFPKQDPRFGLPRRDDLHFVVLAKVRA